MPVTCPKCKAVLPTTWGSAPLEKCLYCGAPVDPSQLTLEVPSGSTAAEEIKKPPAPAAAARRAEPADPPVDWLAALSERAEARQDSARAHRLHPAQPLRSARFSPLLGIFMVLVSLLFVVAGVAIYMKDLNEYRQLQQEGQLAQAVITRLEEDDSGDSTSYYVHYTFTAPWNGASTRFNHRDDVDESLFDSLQERQAVEIIYAPSDPKIASLKATLRPPSVFILAMMVGAGLVGVGIDIWLVRTINRTRDQVTRLRAQGRKAQGTVVDRWEDHHSEEGSNECIAYSFEAPLPGGQSVTVTRSEYNSTAYRALQVGDRVWVRYLAEDPKICQLMD